MIKFLAALAIIGLNGYAYFFLATDERLPERRSFADFPLEIGSWQCPAREEMRDKVLQNLGASDYVICQYRDGETGDWINVYVGYHQTQIVENGGGTIHPPEHCLPGSGWNILDSEVVDLDLPGLPGDRPRAKRFVIAKGDHRQLVYFWYQSRGRVLATDFERLLWRLWDRAFRKRTDGALIRLMVAIPPNGSTEDGEAVVERFGRRLTPLLPEYLPL